MIYSATHGSILCLILQMWKPCPTSNHWSTQVFRMTLVGYPVGLTEFVFNIMKVKIWYLTSLLCLWRDTRSMQGLCSFYLSALLLKTSLIFWNPSLEKGTNHFSKGPVIQWVLDNGLANNPFPNHLGSRF